VEQEAAMQTTARGEHESSGAPAGSATEGRWGSTAQIGMRRERGGGMRESREGEVRKGGERERDAGEEGNFSQCGGGELGIAGSAAVACPMRLGIGAIFQFQF